MYAPFMEAVSGYKFMMNQSMIFAILFSITLIFIIYISNYIDICVYRKRYALMHVMGHSMLNILKINFAINAFMIVLTPLIYITNINAISYLLMIIIDMISLICLYNKLIKNDVSLSINGG